MSTPIKQRFDYSYFWAPIFILTLLVAAGELLTGRYRFLSSNTIFAVAAAALLLEIYTFYEERRQRFPRALLSTVLLVATATFIEIDGVAHLIHLLVFSGQAVKGSALLASGAYYWTTNVLVFGLWYWLIDRGGPHLRSHGADARADFFFPEMAAGDLADRQWRPTFGSYMYLAFTNATAFSPTDTLPLSDRARALMTAEAAISLMVIALVMARAVNILL